MLKLLIDSNLPDAGEAFSGGIGHGLARSGCPIPWKTGRFQVANINPNTMNKLHKLAIACTCASLAASTAVGQLLPGPAQPDTLPRQGTREVTFAGSGQSDKDLDNGSVGFEGSWGWYTTDRWLISFRQTLNNLGDSDDWSGATLAAADYHFLDGAWRPFLGINAGVRYGGRTVGDSFAAGAQAGLKYYLEGNAFLFGRADYSYTFDEVEDVEDAWDQGGLGYAFGVGLNF